VDFDTDFSVAHMIMGALNSANIENRPHIDHSYH
jgi:hypothetical protein